MLSKDHVQQLWNRLTNNRLKKIATQMVETTNNHINESLKCQKLNIGQFKELNLQKPTVKYEQREESIKKRKQDLLKRMKQIQQQEQEIKMKMKTQVSIKIRRNKNKQKSIMTVEDVAKIKNLFLINKNFNENLKLKDMKIKQSIQHEQENEKIKFQNKIQQLRKMKRASISIRLKEQQRRSNDRKNIIQYSQNELKQVLNKKYLYKQYEQKYKLKEQSIQKLKQQQYLAMANRLKQFDIEKIKQHDKKYKEMMQKQKQQRMKKLEQFKQSVLYKNDKQIKKQDTIKNQKIQRKNHNQRMKQFIKKIHQQNKKMNPAQKKSMPQVSRIKTVRSLSAHQLKSIGNQYMQLSKKILKKQINSNNQQTTIIQSPKKIDYLKQIKQLNKHKKNKNNNDMIKINQLLSPQNKSKSSLQQAIQIVHKMESDKDQNQQKLINIIQAKMKILEQIY